jgi:hypothetical protein
MVELSTLDYVGAVAPLGRHPGYAELPLLCLGTPDYATGCATPLHPGLKRFDPSGIWDLELVSCSRSRHQFCRR